MTQKLTEDERVKQLRELTEKEAKNPKFKGSSPGEILRALVKPKRPRTPS